MSAVPVPLRPAAAPPVTNSRIASALLALADAEEPGARPAAEYRDAARTLRQLPEDLFGRRVSIASLPGVSPRAADAIAAFLSCGSDDVIGDRLAAILDRSDRSAPTKADFLSRADADRILAAPGGISMADLMGDVHVHSDRSDGKMPLPALHRALEARGDRYALLTDHARDCAVAGGLFPADFTSERREVDRLNGEAANGFAMFLGAEANIAGDGSIDILPSRVPEVAGVVASVHTDLRSPRDQTARLLRAVETPGVAVLGHPRGRLYNVRAGLRADWPRVFARAAERRVAVELNGCPERLDLSPSLARQAEAAGCLFAVVSDAHAARHLSQLSYALAVARLAGIPAERVVNTWPTERFGTWLEEMRER